MREKESERKMYFKLGSAELIESDEIQKHQNMM